MLHKKYTAIPKIIPYIFIVSSIVYPTLGLAVEDVAASAASHLHSRALAASCAACHGTFGNAVTTNHADANSGTNAILAGINPADFKEKMLGFKDGSRKATVMHHHAKGLTVDEINLLAEHFSEQKLVVTTPIKSQVLKSSHE
ncbi:MAG: hypothetical protein Q8M99_10915 [Methylotenera sp.]|nr:hypothetical protein [Methylotenera sp.]